MLIRPAHTSPSDNKTKQEWKQGGGGGNPADNCGGMGLPWPWVWTVYCDDSSEERGVSQ